MRKDAQMLSPESPLNAAPTGPKILDSTEATFMADVAEASMKGPVIVDFWADWCGPCKQLTPLLERLVAGSNANLTLVKINADQNPRLCQQLRVQSLPTVMAFVGGRPVDGFAGALPESQLKQFIDRLVKAAGGPLSAADLEAAKQAFADGDIETALEIFAAIAEGEPDNGEALGGLIHCYVKLGEIETAKQIVAAVTSKDARKAQAFQAAEAAIALADHAGSAGDADEFAARLAADPNDHEARFELAKALLSRGDRDGAAEALLEIFRRDRAWNEDAARKQLVQMFEAVGPMDPFTLKYRRKLSSMMFT